MNEHWLSDTPIGMWYDRTYKNRISFAGAMLRLVGWLGGLYCVVLIVLVSVRWFQAALEYQLYHELPVVGPEIVGYGLRLVLFLLAYAAGAVLPVLVKPEQSAVSRGD